MSGCIFDIRHFSVHDGPGIRSTIFLKGCPLKCVWCHNPESQSPKPEVFQMEKKLDGESFFIDNQVGKNMTVDDVFNEILPQIGYYEESNGGITLSGGEPLMQTSFSEALLKKAKQEGIHTAVDTCGFASKESFEQIAPYTDLFLYDLKIIDNKLHQEYTGVPSQPIIDNLQLLDKMGKRIILRIPLIDGITDTANNLLDVRKLIESLQHIERIDLLPYHPIAKGKYKRADMDYTLADMPTYDHGKVMKKMKFFNGLTVKISIGG